MNMNADSQTPISRLVLWFGVLVAPFLLNDFANIYVHNYQLWLAIDVVFVKALPFAVIIYLLLRRVVTFGDLGIKKLPVINFVFWTVLMTILGCCTITYGFDVLRIVIPSVSLGYIPRDTSSWLYSFDLHLGLLSVGVLEEVIFRGFSYVVLRKMGLGSAMTILISALLFGLIHWSFGIARIVITSIFGLIFMLYRWKTGNIVPLIFAHYAVNYLIVSGIWR